MNGYWQIVQQYVTHGFTHVLPLGYDHILFILSLFFLNAQLKSVLVQCTVFTLAHSLALGLASYGLLLPNAAIIEPLIAVSILFTAIENIIHSKVNPWRIIIIFAFGLVHGLGFASALQTIGISQIHFLSSLLSFNVGVEFGQIAVIVMAYFGISKWWSGKPWYKERIVYPISALIGCIALYWTIERILLT